MGTVLTSPPLEGSLTTHEAFVAPLAKQRLDRLAEAALPCFLNMALDGSCQTLLL